jgi:hypothetical protein
MSPEKEAALVAIYPPLFKDLSDLSCMKLFGFECGDGWFNLLKDLIEELKVICEAETTPLEDGEDFSPVVNQVKEKFGTLRFYISSTTQNMRDAIDKAEARSEETCEKCGNPGAIQVKHGWAFVRCGECYKPDCAST